MSCRVCEPTQLHHTITVVNLPLLMLIKIFEGNKEYNESLIPDLNSATGDQGGIFKDQLIQRVTVGELQDPNLSQQPNLMSRFN